MILTILTIAAAIKLAHKYKDTIKKTKHDLFQILTKRDRKIG